MRHIADRAIDLVLPDRNPAGVVYAILLIGAVLATESLRRETLGRTLALLIASAVGVSLDTGVLIAVWSSAASIFVLEFVAGIRAGLRGTEVCAGAVMGLAMIGLRVVLH